MGRFLPVLPYGIHNFEITQVLSPVAGVRHHALGLPSSSTSGQGDSPRPYLRRRGTVGGGSALSPSCTFQVTPLRYGGSPFHGAGSAGPPWRGSATSAESPERGNYFLLMGTICAPLLFLHFRICFRIGPRVRDAFVPGPVRALRDPRHAHHRFRPGVLTISRATTRRCTASSGLIGDALAIGALGSAPVRFARWRWAIRQAEGASTPCPWWV